MVVKLRVTGPKLLTGYMLVFLGPKKVTDFKIVNSRVQRIDKFLNSLFQGPKPGFA